MHPRGRRFQGRRWSSLLRGLSVRYMPPSALPDRRVGVYGPLSARQPANDLWIAATALTHDFTLMPPTRHLASPAAHPRHTHPRVRRRLTTPRTGSRLWTRRDRTRRWRLLSARRRGARRLSPLRGLAGVAQSTVSGTPSRPERSKLPVRDHGTAAGLNWRCPCRVCSIQQHCRSRGGLSLSTIGRLLASCLLARERLQ